MSVYNHNNNKLVKGDIDTIRNQARHPINGLPDGEVTFRANLGFSVGFPHGDPKPYSAIGRTKEEAENKLIDLMIADLEALRHVL